MSRPTRIYPDPPQGFAARFIVGGWRGIELYYGASTPLLLKWIDACGGEDLHRRRREHYRAKQPCVTPQSRVA
jgi:hypothetical protein